MPAVLGPALVAAALLALAGAQKLVDPTLTVGALRALGLPSSVALVRAGSAIELAVGVAAATFGGGGLWAMVALSYLAFTAVVIAALRSGTMLGTCGCFGRDETPPHVTHIVANLGLALAAAVAGRGGSRGIADLPASPVAAAGMVALVAVALALVHATYVQVPRAMSAARAVRELDLPRLGVAGGSQPGGSRS